MFITSKWLWTNVECWNVPWSICIFEIILYSCEYERMFVHWHTLWNKYKSITLFYLKIIHDLDYQENRKNGTNWIHFVQFVYGCLINKKINPFLSIFPMSISGMGSSNMGHTVFKQYGTTYSRVMISDHGYLRQSIVWSLWKHCLTVRIISTWE